MLAPCGNVLAEDHTFARDTKGLRRRLACLNGHSFYVDVAGTVAAPMPPQAPPAGGQAPRPVIGRHKAPTSKLCARCQAAPRLSYNCYCHVCQREFQRRYRMSLA